MLTFFKVAFNGKSSQLVEKKVKHFSKMKRKKINLVAAQP